MSGKTREYLFSPRYPVDAYFHICKGNTSYNKNRLLTGIAQITLLINPSSFWVPIYDHYCSESAGDIAQYVFDNWPEEWKEEAVSKAEILRLIYQVGCQTYATGHDPKHGGYNLVNILSSPGALPSRQCDSLSAGSALRQDCSHASCAP